MSKIVYVLTVIYFAYVMEKAEGERIAALIKQHLHIDVTQWRSFVDPVVETIMH